jgi:hypothetical protein
MVNPLVKTASRIVRLHQDILPCLVRIQNGFMRERNIDSAERVLDELEALVRDIRREIRTQHPSDPFIPLK